MSTTLTPFDTHEPRRPVYLDGLPLTAAALNDEGAARGLGWERHQSKAHPPGIVAGLWIELATDFTSVTVTRGSATDSQGRLLLLANDVAIHDPSLTDDLQKLAATIKAAEAAAAGGTASASVAIAAVKTPTAYDVYLVDATQLKALPEGSVRPARWSEHAEIRLVQRSLEADCTTPPAVSPPGVLLGTIEFRDQQHSPVINYARRCYVGAVGVRIHAPSGRARMLLGPESPGDVRHFAILAQRSANTPPTDVLTWESTRSLRLKSPTTIDRHPRQTPDPATPRLPVMLHVAAPSPWITRDDLLDVCGLWWQLKEDFLPGKVTAAAENEKNFHNVVRQLFIYKANPGKPIDIVQQLMNAVLALWTSDPTDWDERAAIIVRTLNVVLRIAALMDPKKNPLLARDIKFRVGESELDLPWPVTDDAPVRRARRFLDEQLAGLIRPLNSEPIRGVRFRDAAAPSTVASPADVRLVQVEVDGQPVEELRLAFHNPGEKNHPEHYRFSVGTFDQLDPQILMVSGDGVVRINGVLKIFADDAGLIEGIAQEIKKPDDPSSTTPPVPQGTAVIGGALVWQTLIPSQSPPGPSRTITFIGSLTNTTDSVIDPIQIVVTIMGVGDTVNPPLQYVLPPHLRLDKQAAFLVNDSSITIPAGDPRFHLSLFIDVLVVGTVDGVAIATTQLRLSLPAF